MYREVFINVQADEPLIHPEMIDELAQVFRYEENIQMATLIRRIQDKEDILNLNTTRILRILVRWRMQQREISLRFGWRSRPSMAIFVDGIWFL